MATNKKKSSSAKSKEAKTSKNAASKTSQEEEANPPAAIENKPTLLTFPQLTSVILLCMGASRIMQVRSAYAIETAADAAAAAEPVKICVAYLGSEAACLDGTILSLLKYKYGTALQMALVAASVIIKFWHADADLSRLNTLLSVTPILTGIEALYLSEAVGPDARWKQLMAGTVLCLLCAPTSMQMLPFYGTSQMNGNSKLTLPAMVVLGLAFWNLVQAATYVWLTLTMTTSNEHDGAGAANLMDSLLPVQTSAFYSLSSELQTAVIPILYFLAVDCFSTASLCAYCWHALPEQRQKVSAKVFFC